MGDAVPHSRIKAFFQKGKDTMDMTAIAPLLTKLIELVKMMLFIRVILSWFPGIDWYNGPFKILRAVTDPILKPFQALIPPLGGLDISPIIAFLALDFLAKMAGQLSFTGGMNLPN
jgi:YggT family protein